jgi:hypothetical protein
MDAGQLLHAECKRLQAENEHLKRQIEILWEIGSENITPEQLENARKGLLQWEVPDEF